MNEGQAKLIKLSAQKENFFGTRLIEELSLCLGGDMHSEGRLQLR